MVTNTFYKLDNLLDVERITQSTGSLRVKRFPRLGNLLANYKKRLNETCVINSISEKARDLPSINKLSEFLNLLPNYILSDETFSQEITFPPIGDFYLVTWNIQKAKEIIKRDSIPVEKFDCNFISQDIDFNTVDKSQFSFAVKNNEPIILVDYHLTNNSTGGLIVIDGNHRVVSRVMSGVRQVEGYRLNRDQQFEALADEFDRCLFKIHSNLHYIVDYIIGRESVSRFQFFDEI